MGETVRWRVLFSGEVQFVGFRQTAQRLARGLSLTGFVRNLPDGRVLLEAQGSVTDVRRLILRLKASPPIRVTGFRVLALPPVPGETRFSVCARG